ncbi:galactose-1-phosphate uridylyltransferase [Candidatus Aerophobetes bacterium]|uniref:Galactose-1-phosphate uridylyltransferase n=1 Tax=Aerophobetes bacterium TaxID=2030807 RepID=A0A662DC93_UNCAE|nr:MAG: galactose-1-phosphate uridylyltransferase [Candidatus Aerophobetes bacterium]
MPELRKNPVSGEWVIISPERGKRKFDFTSKTEEKKILECSFCEGHEDETPSEVFSIRKKGTKPDSPGWWIRVVPNKYPALSIGGKPDIEKNGIYLAMKGVGVHEVIIETPDHKKDLFNLENSYIAQVIRVYRDRLVKLAEKPFIKYVLIFKNQGREAGASSTHSHSQIIATPVIPGKIREELKKANRYYNSNKKCIFCDIISKELTLQRRVILENKLFLAFTPYASRFPFEICILPKNHDFVFQKITRDESICLAQILKDVIGAMNKALSNPSYNYFFHIPPGKKGFLKYYHCHLEIIPRLTKLAGFELGTGFYINPVSPEEAAARLRENIHLSS